ncbi:hypothetical protein DFH28DRAFT_878191 [Melampsora americana]|nr:hypothetical protein DFH28DRAFT_878191 [Melampsora americana]
MPEQPVPSQSQQSKKKGTYKCSKCKSTGHRANACPENQKLTDTDQDLDKGESEEVISQNVPNESSAAFNVNVEQSTPKEDASESEKESPGWNLNTQNSPESDSSFDVRWNRDLWGADDQPRCPLCDEPLPEKPSEKFKEMLRHQLAKPHAKKRPLPGNPDAVDLPYIERASTCAQHDMERNIIPHGQERGWPSAFDPEILRL